MKVAPLKISLFVVITISILMIVAGLLFYKNVIGLLGAWNQSNKMSIFLKIDANTEDKNKIISLVTENLNVANVVLVDRAQAGATFQSSLKEFASGLITADEMLDLIPETIEVDLKNSTSLAEREVVFTELAAQLKLQPQIEEISYSASWLKKFEVMDNILRSSGLLIFLVVLCSTSFLVSLMVRVYIEESKQEIEVYSLLGATKWSIYKLFLKDVFIFLSASLALSFALLYGGFIFLKNRLLVSGLSSIVTDNLRFLSDSEIAFVVTALFVFIYTSSFFTIQTSVNKLNQLSND